MKKYFLFRYFTLLVIVLLSQIGNSQLTLADSIEMAIIKPYVQHLNQKREVFYIHANKQIFLAGEPLAFKVYVVAAHNRLPFLETRNVYAEVLDEEGKQVDKQIIYAEGGSANGSFLLPSTLTPGNYLLRTYTAWSRNFDPAYYGTLSIQVLGPTKDNGAVSSNVEKYELASYPEGGSFIAGVPTNFGFKLTERNGSGVSSVLTVLKNGLPVKKIETNALGFASISILGNVDDIFQVSWQTPSGVSDSMILPKPLSKGMHLSVVNPINDSVVNIEVRTNPETLRELGYQKFYLLLHRQGVVHKLNWVSFISRRTWVSQQFLRKDLPEGVFHITLFDSLFRPIGDRAVFNSGHTTADLDVTASTENDSVWVQLSAKGPDGTPIEADLSMSFLPTETEADHFSSTVFSRYLVEQDIRGVIENPAYYFEKKDSIYRKHLDDLLIVQGWRMYNWNTMLNEKAKKGEFPFEQGFAVRGKLPAYTHRKQKTDPQLILSSPQQELFVKTPIDSTGYFEWRYLFVQQGIAVSLFAQNSSERKKYQNLSIIPATNYFDSSRSFSFIKPKPITVPETEFVRIPGKLLDEIKIKKRLDNRTAAAINPLLTEMDKVHVFDDNDRIRYRTLKEYLSQKHRIRTYEKLDPETGRMVYHMDFNLPSSFLLSTDPVLVIDGMPISDLRIIEFLPTWDIEAIAVEKYGSALAAFGAGGAIIIKTRDAQAIVASASKETNAIKQLMLDGYTVASEYFTPAYPFSQTTSTVKRFACLYWKPNITTDSTGKTFFAFPASWADKSFRIVAEGIGKKGELFYLKKDLLLSRQ